MVRKSNKGAQNGVRHERWPCTTGRPVLLQSSNGPLQSRSPRAQSSRNGEPRGRSFCKKAGGSVRKSSKSQSVSEGSGRFSSNLHFSVHDVFSTGLGVGYWSNLLGLIIRILPLWSHLAEAARQGGSAQVITVDEPGRLRIETAAGRPFCEVRIQKGHVGVYLLAVVHLGLSGCGTPSHRAWHTTVSLGAC